MVRFRSLVRRPRGAGRRSPNPRRIVIFRPDFWRGRRVFLTGHTGFKGSWLSLWLKGLGAETTGYALPAESEPNLFGAARVADSVHSIVGDVRDLDALTDAIALAQPEVVFHLAAQPIVRQSYADPVGTFSTNVLGTVHLLEAIRRVGGVRAVVVVTSDKCYQNREWYWSYREKSALGGRDPYSASKACAEIVTRAFRKSYFEEADDPTYVATARAGNVIGGGDWAPDRLVPDTVQALKDARPVELRYPNAIRPWQHVLEPLTGYLMLAERLHRDGDPFTGGWNFAPWEDDARSVGWLSERLQEGWGVRPTWRPQDGPRPHEQTFLKLDASKARSLLGWQPVLDVATAVDWIVEWYRAYYDGADARELVVEQIERYRNAAAAVHEGAST